MYSGTLRAMILGFCGILASLVLPQVICCVESVGRAMSFKGVMWTAVRFVAYGFLMQLRNLGFRICYSIAWFFKLVIPTAILHRDARSTP